MSKTSDTVVEYGAGAGLYYFMNWVFVFYPAFIVSLTFQRVFYGMECDGGGYILSIILMILCWFGLLVLVFLKQWFPLLMAYLITLWPWGYIVVHCIRNSGEMTTFPLPLDWCPLW